MISSTRCSSSAKIVFRTKAKIISPLAPTDDQGLKIIGSLVLTPSWEEEIPILPTSENLDEIAETRYYSPFVIIMIQYRNLAKNNIALLINHNLSV